MIKINNNNQIEVYGANPVYQNGEIAFFTCTISIREMGEMFNRLSYDGNAQRGYSHTDNGDKPILKKEHVEEIKREILNGGNVTGHLTWNIRVSEDLKNEDIDYYTYIPEKELLIINGNTITVPDSFHRHTAGYELCLTDNVDDVLNYQFPLDIHNKTVEEEKEYFSSINGKGLQIPRNRILFLNADIESCFLRDVIENSSFREKVECELGRTPITKMVKFSTIRDSLFAANGAFKNYKDKLEDENVYKYLKRNLINFYNELLDSRDEFNYINETKKNNKQVSMLLEEIMWWGYAYIASKIDFQEDHNWKRFLRNKMNKKIAIQGMMPIDFWSKFNPTWDVVRQRTLNVETNTVELAVSCINSNVTTKRIQTIIALNLFS